jgi:hypothetical protein
MRDGFPHPNRRLDIVRAESVSGDYSGYTAHARSAEQAECHDIARKQVPRDLIRARVEAQGRERENAYSAVRVRTKKFQLPRLPRDSWNGSEVAIYCLSNCTVGPVSLVPVLRTQSVRKV